MWFEARLGKTILGRKGPYMLRILVVTVSVVCCFALLVNAAFAEAKDDCRIEFQKGVNGEEAHVKNTNTQKKIKVTVAVKETTNGTSRDLPNKVLTLAAGEKAFCGATQFNGSTYTYTITGASYE
jgi:hypothetical protein